MKKFWILAACAATFYACSSSDINTPEFQETGTLQVSTSVLTQNTKGARNTPSTKADNFHSGPVMGTELAQGSQIGVFVFNKDSEQTKTSYTGSKNELNAALNQAWENNSGWDGPNFILGIQPADVYAYFPYDINTTDYDAIPVLPGYTDYLYGMHKQVENGKDYVNSTNNQANIQLNHALAMISFTFTKDKNYPEDEACQVNAITINNLPAKGTMSVVDGIPTPENHVKGNGILPVKGFVGNGYTDPVNNGWNNSEFRFNNGIIGTVTGNPVATAPLFHALVLPNTGMPNKENITDSELHAVIKIDGVSYKIALNVITTSNGNANSWESNKHYTYNLTIKGTSGQGNQLVVSSVTVKQWEQGGNSNIEI